MQQLCFSRVAAAQTDRQVKRQLLPMETWDVKALCSDVDVRAKGTARVTSGIPECGFINVQNFGGKFTLNII